jgi:hypothetical protein
MHWTGSVEKLLCLQIAGDAAAITQEANSVRVPLQRNSKEDVMKRNLIATLSLVGMSLLLNINGAYAQSGAQAVVPFAFNVGSSQLPAGSYKITFEDLSGMVTIRNSTTGAISLHLGQRDYFGDKSWKLVFQHAGNRYSLTQICVARGLAGVRLSAPKPETKLETASKQASSGKEVEIALK